MAQDVVDQVAAAERRGSWPGGADDEHGALDVADRGQRAEPALDVAERGRAGLGARGGEPEQRPARRELRGAAGLGHPEAAVGVLGAADVVDGGGGVGGRGEREHGEEGQRMSEDASGGG